MSLKGMKVGIIGGSISGCAAAFALAKNGFEVEVFERSSNGLRDRGSGIAIPKALRAQLIEKGYLPDNYPNCTLAKRRWMYPDGTLIGKCLAEQPTPAYTNNWGNLWAALRSNVPDSAYLEGKTLNSFNETTTGVQVTFEDGDERQFDLLIGADGYSSAVRHALHPDATPAFAGYVLWRGNYPESELQDHSAIEMMDRDNTWITVPFCGGHGVIYMIPDFDGTKAPGGRRVNWAIYAKVPNGLILDGIESIPPGLVPAVSFNELQALLHDHFPPTIGDVIRNSKHADISIQPIYDSQVDTYISKRVLLMGDAGTVNRPHTASGATKALDDALALEEIAGTTDRIDELLKGYDAQRCEAAKTLCGIGRRIGRAQVEETPDWESMDQHSFDAWTQATLAGDKLYLYGQK